MKTKKILALSACVLTISALSGTVGLCKTAPHPAASASAKDKHADPIVLIRTDKGDIKIKVFKNEAPITAGNFLDLVGKHLYDGLTFHRVEDWVIQGGDPTGTGHGNYIDPATHEERHIKLEKVASLKHDSPGTVAMARTNDPNSASCQFYITKKATPFLDDPPGYAVFGKVIEGMDVVNKIGIGDKMTRVAVEK